MAVRAEVSVVSAIAGSAFRFTLNRTTNSVARCWASAALPPFPKKTIFPSRSKAPAIAFASCTKGASSRVLESSITFTCSSMDLWKYSRMLITASYNSMQYAFNCRSDKGSMVVCDHLDAYQRSRRLESYPGDQSGEVFLSHGVGTQKRDSIAHLAPDFNKRGQSKPPAQTHIYNYPNKGLNKKHNKMVGKPKQSDRKCCHTHQCGGRQVGKQIFQLLSNRVTDKNPGVITVQIVGNDRLHDHAVNHGRYAPAPGNDDIEDDQDLLDNLKAQQ